MESCIRCITNTTNKFMISVAATDWVIEPTVTRKKN